MTTTQMAAGAALRRGPERIQAALSPRRGVVRLLAAAVVAILAFFHPASVPRVSGQPPSSLRELEPWTDYKTRAGLSSLPEEARLFYRQGILALRQHDPQSAARLLRGAYELDPAFLAPRLALVRLFAFQQPSQALLQAAAILDLVRDRFSLQLILVSNLLFVLIHALLMGLLGVGILLVLLHSGEIRHPIEERLQRWISVPTSRLWALVLIVLPFLCGFGIALPTVALLALLWPNLRTAERALAATLTAGLVAIPVLAGGLERFDVPLRPDDPPLYGIQALEDASDPQIDLPRLRRLSARNPQAGYLDFAYGWAARKCGDLATAERAYRAALADRGRQDRTWNNLANTLALQGRSDEALDAYQRAIAANARLAAAHFNLAQLLNQRFDYIRATEELATASALDFELVRTHQSEMKTNGRSPLVDCGLDPLVLWNALLRAPRPVIGTVMPLAWRGFLESSGLGASGLVLAVALGALVLGWRLHKDLPARHCANCNRVICRRCAVRRRELALCQRCHLIMGTSDNENVARVMLGQQRRRAQQKARFVRTASAALIPGLGLLSHRRVVVPVLLLGTVGALLGPVLGLEGTLPLESGVFGASTSPLGPARLTLWILIYLVSILGYWECARRADAQTRELQAPVSQRVRQATPNAA